MNESQQLLARRLVEHPAWRWMPGMRAVSDSGESGFARHIETISSMSSPWYQWNDIWLDDAVPDLTDPATVGCLLALARELLGDFAAHTCVLEGSDGYGWTVCALVAVAEAPVDGQRHATEVEAIAHAILAAPTKETT